jgi:hypothetical protein
MDRSNEERGVFGLVVVAMTVLVPLAATAASLEAGIATGNITPDTSKLHVPLGGYGDRMNAAAEGVHDNTMVKALVLRDGDKKFAFVTVDILGIVRPLRDEVLERIGETGITSDNLMISASHTHASVEMNALHSGNIFGIPNIGIYDEKLLMFTADRIADAIAAANEKFVPVRVGTKSRDVPGLNRNRRGDPTTDDEVTVTRIDTVEGKALAVLVNYTAHPTFMNEKVMHVSAGWPGYLQREVEAFVGGGAMCMYSNGAQGDIGPAGADGPSPYARAESHGRSLAIQVLDLVDEIETQSDVEFEFAMHTLKLPPRTVPPALLESAGPEYGIDESNAQVLIDALVPESSYLGVLKLGDLVAVSIPGELFSRLGLEVKASLESAGAKHPIIVGLGNEWISYMMPPEEFDQGGYEPGVSFYGPSLGPEVVRQAITAGEDMLKR